jgi:hypothetical protein
MIGTFQVSQPRVELALFFCHHPDDPDAIPEFTVFQRPQQGLSGYRHIDHEVSFRFKISPDAG